MVICLERGADLHIAQLMPLPLIVSCSSKIQIGFTFLVPAYPGSPGKRAVKQVCVCRHILSLTKRFRTGQGPHVVLTCANEVSPNRLPVTVASDRPRATLSTRAH